ncbi:MAG: L-serine ammonia-lyase, iron-sulfur-dependent, subunit alpha [Bacteroidaceae bacterium]|nr:L-serine ammonia-lyase, iron-sulfur-dependent, subunit alpha [Bacteroidaceae bacterium]
MDNNEIIELIKKEVVPAMGCTEPMAVALCVSYATQELGTLPERIEVWLSANMLKNAMGVGIPGTGMTGLPIAIALGAMIGKSCYGLEVLKDVNADAVAAGRCYVEEKRIGVHLKDNISEKLYIEVLCTAGGMNSKAIISHDHTHLAWLEGPSGIKVQEEGITEGIAEEEAADGLTLRRVYDFATTIPLEQIEFINEARRLNEKAAKLSLAGNYGHELGKTLSRPLGKGILGDSIFCHILSATSGACDARMAGAQIPVMSNSGSGNQGIAATMPVVVFAEENHNTEEELTRALILSHLTAIYIKQSLGRLSALCGCVVASTGSSCGITYLMGGNFDQIASSIKNMVANLAGMLCDGAKPSCALKVSSGVSTAVLSALLAIQNNTVSSAEGLVEDDVDKCIRNLTRVGSKGMDETDRMVLDIMTHKE